MQQSLWIGFAGALGTLEHHTLTGIVQRTLGSSFPWGTFVVNVLGSFLVGFIWSLAEGRLPLTPQTRTIVLTGFMGAFTTFSTFMFETGNLMRDTQWLWAGGNITLQIILGLLCLFAGLALGRLI